MISTTTCDVVIVGAGPAGLAAAMFTARRGLSTHIVSKDLGGQLALTEWIENYPGVDRAGGRELCERFLAQAKRDGAHLQFGEVITVQQRARGEANSLWYEVRLAGGEALHAKVVILAFGLTPNDLGVEGEHRFHGRGAYYSAVDDAPKQDGKRVVVVGGGDGAVTAALTLASAACQVTLIHRRGALRAERKLLDALAMHANIDVRKPFAVRELRGSEHLDELVLVPSHPETGVPTEGVPHVIAAESVFVQIGFRANTTWLKGVVELNARNEVIVDRDGKTSTPGIFAAGDVTDIPYKQTAISSGEGIKAALQAFKYLEEQRGKPAVLFDWDARGKG